LRFFIYSRKSVFTGKGESIENQIEICRQYISTIENSSAAEIAVYEDEGYSGKNTDRPEFQKMLADIRANKPDYVVCYRLDRISRNVSDFSSLIEEFNDRGISFVCVKEEFDTSKPMGKAMMYIASVFAQLERETLAERVRDNMMMLARTGRWLGGATPTGFASEQAQEVVMDGRVIRSCRLKPVPSEIATVKTMFDQMLELRSVSGVSKYLIHNGIKNRAGKFYSLLGIKEILQNPVYCVADQDAFAYFTGRRADVCFSLADCSDKLGLTSYNKRDYRKSGAPRQPVDRWTIAVGKHRGIVNGAKWVTVQSIIADNKPDGVRPAVMHNEYSLLSGLVYCDKCGNRMFAKRRQNRNGRFDYICGNKLRGGLEVCSCANLNGRQADDLACECLLQYANETSGVFKMLDRLKRDSAGKSRENPLDTVQARIRKCGEETDRLVDTLSLGSLSPVLIQRVNARVLELDKEIEDLTAQRIRLQETAESFTDKELQTDRTAGALSNLKNNFASLSVHEKRVLIKLLTQKIVWDGQDLHIFLYGG